jgi:ribonuclease T2
VKRAQGETSRGPEYCGPARPVSQAIIQATLSYIPTESLIQHEWATHGTCSGLDAAGYSTVLRKARDSVTLPVELNQPSRRLDLSLRRSNRESKRACHGVATEGGAHCR